MGYTKATRKFGAGELWLVPLPAGDTYSEDITGDAAVVSADSVTAPYTADRAFDDITTPTYHWLSNALAGPHWVKCDMGVGVTKIARRFRMRGHYGGSNSYYGGNGNHVILQGSNNDSSWDVLLTMTVGGSPNQVDNDLGWDEFNFDGTLAYRYFRILTDSTATLFIGIGEIEIMELEGEGVSEIPFTRTLGTDMLGAISTYTATPNAIAATVGGIDITAEAETFADEIDQEQSPVQTIVAGASGFLEFGIPMGDPQLLALAAGLTGATAEADILGTDDDADTVILGARQPQEFSILHRCLNPHNTSFYDYVYIPRAAVIPAPTLNFSRKGPRDHRVRFALLPSVQTGMQVNGMGALFKVIHQNAT